MSVCQALLVVQGWCRADVILCQGTLELQWMNRHFPMWRGKLRSYVTALSGEDQAGLRNVRVKRNWRELKQRILFLWIGRWVRHKGNIEFLEFARKWLADRPQDRFTIAGCGSIELPPTHGMLLRSGQVRIVPNYAREELASLLAEHDVGLFTSNVEGWGLVLNEMLESGMTVYATSTGGVSDLRPHFGGLLGRFPPTIPEVESVRAAAVDWDNYYNTFNWQAIARKYVESISSKRKLKLDGNGP
jgi:glycosyltransferase involved in cell wall biosynthesis